MKYDKELNKVIFGICGIAMVCVLLSFCGCSKNLTLTQGPAGPMGPQGITGTNGAQGAGAQGNQGYGAGVQVTQLVVGDPNCANGGVQILTYQDLTNSGSLTSDDPLLGLSYVCNGATGVQGQAGINGTNGTKVLMEQME